MDYRELNVPAQIHQAVERMGFTEMTEVQEKAIPPMMEGKDIIAKAPTGTGKTCAFGIPLIVGLDAEKKYPQAVVMAPTRELAQQITEDLRDLAHFYPEVRVACVYGGANMNRQIEQLKKGPQIIVATPGRLQDHMKRRTVDLSHVETIVLDEADEMLNMGFYKDVRHILDTIKSRKRLAMFSATISREVMDIGWLYQRDAEEITVQPVEDSMPKIDQYMICLLYTSVVGLGGIATARDALEFLMAGATAVQVGTANFMDPKACEKIADGIADWMDAHGVKTLNEIRGAARV